MFIWALRLQVVALHAIPALPSAAALAFAFALSLAAFTNTLAALAKLLSWTVAGPISTAILAFALATCIAFAKVTLATRTALTFAKVTLAKVLRPRVEEAACAA